MKTTDGQINKSHQFDLFAKDSVATRPHFTLTKESMRLLQPIKPTEVYPYYWYLATERQKIFFGRFRRKKPPWSKDIILQQHKFTNAYRASDRVSQFLIRNVIYEGSPEPEEVFFRTILFKMFNLSETWNLLRSEFGEISYREFSLERYSRFLGKEIASGRRLYSAAYIMPPVRVGPGGRKHVGHLTLLDMMMRDELPARLAESRSLRQAFELLRTYPMMGDFLAYQYITDLNYGPVLNFPEMEFILPGPGAKRGIAKCFSNTGGLNESDVIRLLAERQEEEFSHFGLEFSDLWGRPLQLIDIQNLFCEIDKYSRVAFPSVTVKGGGKRIKQRFLAKKGELEYWYPPKWGLNELIAREKEAKDAYI